MATTKIEKQRATLRAVDGGRVYTGAGRPSIRHTGMGNLGTALGGAFQGVLGSIDKRQGELAEKAAAVAKANPGLSESEILQKAGVPSWFGQSSRKAVQEIKGESTYLSAAAGVDSMFQKYAQANEYASSEDLTAEYGRLWHEIGGEGTDEFKAAVFGNVERSTPGAVSRALTAQAVVRKQSAQSEVSTLLSAVVTGGGLTAESFTKAEKHLRDKFVGENKHLSDREFTDTLVGSITELSLDPDMDSATASQLVGAVGVLFKGDLGQANRLKSTLTKAGERNDKADGITLTEAFRTGALEQKKIILDKLALGTALTETDRQSATRFNLNLSLMEANAKANLSGRPVEWDVTKMEAAKNQIHTTNQGWEDVVTDGASGAQVLELKNYFTQLGGRQGGYSAPISRKFTNQLSDSITTALQGQAAAADFGVTLNSKTSMPEWENPVTAVRMAPITRKYQSGVQEILDQKMGVGEEDAALNALRTTTIANFMEEANFPVKKVESPPEEEAVVTKPPSVPELIARSAVNVAGRAISIPTTAFNAIFQDEAGNNRDPRAWVSEMLFGRDFDTLTPEEKLDTM